MFYLINKKKTGCGLRNTNHYHNNNNNNIAGFDVGIFFSPQRECWVPNDFDFCSSHDRRADERTPSVGLLTVRSYYVQFHSFYYATLSFYTHVTPR